MTDRTPTQPCTLAQLGVTPPANWRILTPGEQLDYLDAIIAAAQRAYRRIDTRSLAATRAEMAANGVDWRVAS
jgi:hypothetical protein